MEDSNTNPLTEDFAESESAGSVATSVQSRSIEPFASSFWGTKSMAESDTTFDLVPDSLQRLQTQTLRQRSGSFLRMSRPPTGSDEQSSPQPARPHRKRPSVVSLKLDNLLEGSESPPGGSNTLLVTSTKSPAGRKQQQRATSNSPMSSLSPNSRTTREMENAMEQMLNSTSRSGMGHEADLRILFAQDVNSCRSFWCNPTLALRVAESALGQMDYIDGGSGREKMSSKERNAARVQAKANVSMLIEGLHELLTVDTHVHTVDFPPGLISALKKIVDRIVGGKRKAFLHMDTLALTLANTLSGLGKVITDQRERSNSKNSLLEDNEALHIDRSNSPLVHKRHSISTEASLVVSLHLDVCKTVLGSAEDFSEELVSNVMTWVCEASLDNQLEALVWFPPMFHLLEVSSLMGSSMGMTGGGASPTFSGGYTKYSFSDDVVSMAFDAIKYLVEFETTPKGADDMDNGNSQHLLGTPLLANSNQEIESSTETAPPPPQAADEPTAAHFDEETKRGMAILSLLQEVDAFPVIKDLVEANLCSAATCVRGVKLASMVMRIAGVIGGVSYLGDDAGSILGGFLQLMVATLDAHGSADSAVIEVSRALHSVPSQKEACQSVVQSPNGRVLSKLLKLVAANFATNTTVIKSVLPSVHHIAWPLGNHQMGTIVDEETAPALVATIEPLVPYSNSDIVKLHFEFIATAARYDDSAARALVTAGGINAAMKMLQRQRQLDDRELTTVLLHLLARSYRATSGAVDGSWQQVLAKSDIGPKVGEAMRQCFIGPTTTDTKICASEFVSLYVADSTDPTMIDLLARHWAGPLTNVVEAYSHPQVATTVVALATLLRTVHNMCGAEAAVKIIDTHGVYEAATSLLKHVIGKMNDGGKAVLEADGFLLAVVASSADSLLEAVVNDSGVMEAVKLTSSAATSKLVNRSGRDLCRRVVRHAEQQQAQQGQTGEGLQISPSASFQSPSPIAAIDGSGLSPTNTQAERLLQLVKNAANLLELHATTRQHIMDWEESARTIIIDQYVEVFNKRRSNLQGLIMFARMALDTSKRLQRGYLDELAEKRQQFLRELVSVSHQQDDHSSATVLAKPRSTAVSTSSSASSSSSDESFYIEDTYTSFALSSASLSNVQSQRLPSKPIVVAASTANPLGTSDNGSETSNGTPMLSKAPPLISLSFSDLRSAAGSVCVPPQAAVPMWVSEMEIKHRGTIETAEVEERRRLVQSRVEIKQRLSLHDVVSELRQELETMQSTLGATTEKKNELEKERGLSVTKIEQLERTVAERNELLAVAQQKLLSSTPLKATTKDTGVGSESVLRVPTPPPSLPPSSTPSRECSPLPTASGIGTASRGAAEHEASMSSRRLAWSETSTMLGNTTNTVAHESSPLNGTNNGEPAAMKAPSPPPAVKNKTRPATAATTPPARPMWRIGKATEEDLQAAPHYGTGPNRCPISRETANKAMLRSELARMKTEHRDNCRIIGNQSKELALAHEAILHMATHLASFGVALKDVPGLSHDVPLAARPQGHHGAAAPSEHSTRSNSPLGPSGGPSGAGPGHYHRWR